MNVLKNKMILSGFRWHGTVPLYKISREIRFRVNTYRLFLTEMEVCFFPAGSSDVNRIVQKLYVQHFGNGITGLKTAIIHFQKNFRLCNN